LQYLFSRSQFQIYDYHSILLDLWIFLRSERFKEKVYYLTPPASLQRMPEVGRNLSTRKLTSCLHSVHIILWFKASSNIPQSAINDELACVLSLACQKYMLPTYMYE